MQYESSQGSERDFSPEELRALLLQFSLDDIARSLFVLNLWLPNIASPIKFEYLYSCFAAIAGNLKLENKIRSYDDFVKFCREILDACPNFSMLEDYIPEADWCELKYFFNEDFYEIFYGANLSSQYDYCYAFEIMQCIFDKEYSQLSGRSPIKEFEFCLTLQDFILKTLSQASVADDRILPGYIEVPSENFWSCANDLMTRIQTDKPFDQGLMNTYSLAIEVGKEVDWPNMDQFVELTFEGRNCFYFFLKFQGRYYPVMPRRFLSVLYDSWGGELAKYYGDIVLLDEYADRAPMVELAKFMRERLDSRSYFGIVSPVDQESRPIDFLFAGAIHTGDRLVFVNLAPISKTLSDLESYLKSLVPIYDRINSLLKDNPARLALPLEREGVEFKGSSLQPTFLTVVPYATTGMRKLEIPRDLNGQIIPINQFVGIVDELENTEELGEFLDFRDNLESMTTIQPGASILDLFGSFRDSRAVLIDGASKPNFIMIDPNWGSNYRFKSLKEFWAKFPAVKFLGHPRSWIFVDEAPPNVIKSRSKKAFAHFETIESCTFILNCPFHLMKVEQLLITDTLLQMLRDGLESYRETLSKMSIMAHVTLIQVLCIPSFLVQSSERLKHLRHLIPDQALWTTDFVRIGPGDLRVCLVFDEERMSNLLLQAQDRSLQIDLLIALLDCLQRPHRDPRFSEIVEVLRAESPKRCRFKLFERRRDVSFPEYLSSVKLEAKHFKLADKSIAEIANQIAISPGDYHGGTTKDVMNSLVRAVVEFINDQVRQFDFEQSMPFLVTNADGLIHRFEIGEFQIEASIEHEVEFDRVETLSKDKSEFYHDHQGYRYLVEKFVQLKPSSSMEMKSENLCYLLALVERVLNLYAASDAVHYGIFPAALTISHDFKAEVKFGSEFSSMQAEYGLEQTRIELGEIGNKKDTTSQPLPVDEYLSRLDATFKEDLEFSLRNLMNVLIVLGRWAEYAGQQERGYYSATVSEIEAVCVKEVRDFSSNLTQKVLQFLTLRQEELLKLDGFAGEANDIPVWEYTKRRTKYLLKPLLEYDGKYHWGPYSANRAAKVWSGIASKQKLSLALTAPKTKTFLTAMHQQIEKTHQELIEKIVNRHTKFVKPNVFIHKIDDSSQDIGDCDVLAYLPETNTILNIEAKIIDPPFCMKDTQRVSRKIFGHTRENGEFEVGYVHKVEKRHEYLESNYARVFSGLGWKVPQGAPMLISIFVTQMAFWWTKFPPAKTNVKFVESRLLEAFITPLEGDNSGGKK